jgi:uncharacterized protein (TIGR02145 family)
MDSGTKIFTPKGGFMKTNKRFLLAAGVSLALAFTFSGCSGDDGGDDSGTTGGVSSGDGGSSSSGGGGSSSSSGGGSSSSGGSTGGNVVICGPAGEGVKIGEQCWLKKNLDVEHNEGKGESWCYGGTDYSTGTGVTITAEEGCAKYGRLYDWAAAMNLPSECNSISCADQIDEPHQGICPEGFHIPTNAEWDALYRAVDGDDGTYSPYGSPTAGSKLKSASGWRPYEGISSTDEFGFSALPGGDRYHSGGFNEAGSTGYWWSATERDASYAYSRDMHYIRDNASWYGNNKGNGFSVRCVKD